VGSMLSCMRRLLIGGFAAGVMLLAGPASSQVPSQGAPPQDAAPQRERVPDSLGATPGSKVRATCERPSSASASASEEPQAPRTRSAATPPAPAVESADETNAFEKAARLYVRLSKLEITREQREFERVATRYAKFKNFTDKLQALREREQEQVFNQNVSTYLRKQAFTKQLVEHRSRETGVVESPR